MKKHSVTILAIGLCLLGGGLVLYKYLFLGYTFTRIIPRVIYEVNLGMTGEGFGDEVRVRTYLPESDSRQKITDEQNSSPDLSLEIATSQNGRQGTWIRENGQGPFQIRYTFTVHSQHIVYRMDSDITRPQKYPTQFRSALEATQAIQTKHPTIEKIFQRVVAPQTTVPEIIRAAFRFCYNLRPKPFKGLTDAVTAASLGEASCNGKSRLFVALLRRAGIPSRLVGGLILKTGSKRTSHQWAEVFVSGYWVPFDTLNNHFAEIPANYLVLYRGDQNLFKHSANINFDYLFKIKRRLAPHGDFASDLSHHPLNAYSAWAAFAEIGIPLSLLKIIIMIPLGAFIVVIFRNVIGLETFGTFLPVLLAVACRGTGYWWGMTGFVLIISLVSVLHYPLEKIGLLHTPKMSILLIFEVALMLFLTVIGVKFGYFEFSHISLFPIAVLTLTGERFALVQIEMGWLRAFKVMAMTIVVVGFCFLAVNSLAMESLFLAFPELLLVLVALNLWLGRWIGIRVTEFHRFRWLVT